MPVKRPHDYYAEMVKSDEHMKRVRAELIFEQTAQETREEAQGAGQKRYGKQVQAEKLKERTLRRRSPSEPGQVEEATKQNNYWRRVQRRRRLRMAQSKFLGKRSTQETRQKRSSKAKVWV